MTNLNDDKLREFRYQIVITPANIIAFRIAAIRIATIRIAAITTA